MQRRSFLFSSSSAALATLAGLRVDSALGLVGTPSTNRGRRQPATGPLRVHPENPRYFTDGRGQAVRLAGHQIFCDVQDNSFSKKLTYENKQALDWAWYLDFAAARNLNFLRNWIIWSTGSGVVDPARTASPMMYRRTGPGRAADGLPKFDLRRFNQAFFDRLRQRMQQAGKRGLYVSLMLFEPYGFGPGENSLWKGNVFNKSNNINGIDVNTDGNDWGTEFFYTKDPTVRTLQYAYVDKVIDTVNDLDNVLYEVANEVYAPEWQYDIIRHIHKYEAAKPKQHLVYMSPGGRTANGKWTDVAPAELRNGPADCIGIKLAPRATFLTNPPVANPAKPVLWDNDHGMARLDPCPHSMPWQAFTRGYHFVLYDKPFKAPAKENAEWDRTRFNIGATVAYAKRFRDLSRMNPHGELSSTRYCLANPGSEYLVYLPTGGKVTVDLSVVQGMVVVEWFNPTAGKPIRAETIRGGGRQDFIPPFPGDAVLYLIAIDA